MAPVLSMPKAVCLCLTVPFLTHARRVVKDDKVSVLERDPTEQGKSQWDAFTDGMSAMGDAMKDGIDRVTPSIHYSCQHKFEAGGSLDRWITVAPDFSGVNKVKKWVNPATWAHLAEETLDIADKEKVTLTFSPFVLRSRKEYTGNILIKESHSVSGETDYSSTYEVQCTGDDELQVVVKKTSNGETSDKVVSFGAFSNGLNLCSKSSEATYFTKAKVTKIQVRDAKGDYKTLPDGQCVDVSTVDPTKGIVLTKLDADLMGSGLENIGDNKSKMQRLTDKISHQVEHMAGDAIGDGEDVAGDAANDAKEVINGFKDDLAGGSVEAGKKTAKWLKKAAFDSKVDTCLCCDEREVSEEDKMASHCMVAYTLGGEDASSKAKYATKAAVGTLYNLAKTAAGWVVPVIGGQLVAGANDVACAFSCQLREPSRFEPYKYSTIQQVPGLAMSTWFIPGPDMIMDAAGR